MTGKKAGTGRTMLPRVDLPEVILEVMAWILMGAGPASRAAVPAKPDQHDHPRLPR